MKGVVKMALAIEQIGKYVSERHAEASANGLLTAGEVAKKLRKMSGEKITAAELKPFADEWHHGGFYKGGSGSTMGRTYFFYPDTNLTELAHKVLAERAEPIVTRYFFSAGFERQIGRDGRKRWQPVAKFEALDCKTDDYYPKKIAITQQDFESLKEFEGRELEPYESFSHFKERVQKC